MNKIPETVKDLPTLEEFSKTLDKSIHQLFVHTRFTGLLDRCDVKVAVGKYGRRKIFNFYRRDNEILDVYLGIE